MLNLYLRNVSLHNALPDNDRAGRPLVNELRWRLHERITCYDKASIAVDNASSEIYTEPRAITIVFDRQPQYLSYLGTHDDCSRQVT